MSNDTTQHAPADVRERVKEPTQALIDDACMWYRHDFGLLSEKERDSVRFEARQWFRAWGKALSNGDDYAALRSEAQGDAEALAALVVRIWTRCQNEGPNYRETDEFWLDFERAYQLAALRSDAQGEDRWEDLVFEHITQAYNEAHAALRDGAQGDAEALAAADMERVPTTKGEI